jgi:hypothetical protein
MSGKRNAAYGRAYSRGWRYGKKYRRGKSSMGISKNMLFWGGAAIGFSNLDEKIPAQYSLLAATAPIYGGGVGKIKAIAQGIVFGNIIQSMVGKNYGSSGSGFGV